jgi:hypothetical protein
MYRHLAGVVVALGLSVILAIDPTAARPKTNSIEIKYAIPTDPAHQPIYDKLKQARALEYVQGMLSSLRLPRRLTLVLSGCGGMSNAWYGHDEINVCYELVADFLKGASDENLPAGLTKSDVLLGPLLDVFLHESGHAVFDFLNIPVLGREEDAADQFSAYIMLQYDKERARRLILGSAYQYKMDVKDPNVAMPVTKFSDEHGIPAQRFFNILCLAYGSDPALFADLVGRYLPKDRAEVCEYEYQRARFALQTLIGPYVDRKAAKRFFKVRPGFGGVQ